jgi:hypothetical protein
MLQQAIGNEAMVGHSVLSDFQDSKQDERQLRTMNALAVHQRKKQTPTLKK